MGIADQRANRHAGGNPGQLHRLAIECAGHFHFGQGCARDLKDAQQRLVPGQGLQVEQLGARSVGHIASMHRAARQIPQQPGIHRAKADLARPGAAQTVRNMLQQPAGLAGREHGVDGQPGQAIDRVGQAASA